MTIVAYGNNIYVGLDADTKPTTNIPNPSFFMTETKSWRWNGSSWSVIGAAFTHEDFDFLVYKTATQYEALNGATGAIDFTNTTDVGAVINSCINAIQPSTNDQAVDKQGTIHIAPGVYTVLTTIVPKNHIAIEGSGIQSTLLELGSTLNIDMIKSFHFSTLTGTNSRYGIFDVTIRDLSLNGTHWQNLTAGCGIKKYGFAWLIENVEIKNFREQAIYSEWCVNGTHLYSDHDVHTQQEQWKNVSFIMCLGGGVLHRGPHDSTVSNCSWYQTDNYGLKLQHLDNVYTGELHLHQCHFWDINNTNSKAIWVEGGKLHFTDLIIETVDDQNTGGYGLLVEGGQARGSYLWVFRNGIGVQLENGGPCSLENVHIENNNVGIVVKGNDHIITGRSINNNNVGNTAGVNLRLGASGLAITRNYINLQMYGAITAQIENLENNWDNFIFAQIKVDSGQISVLQTVFLNPSSNVLQFLEQGAGTHSGYGRPINEGNSTTLYNKTLNYPTINGRKGGDLARSSTYSAADTDEIIRCSGSFTVTLPTAVGREGKWYTIVKVDSATSGPITVATTSSQTIGGVLNYLLRSENRFITIESDGANWKLVGFVVPVVEGTFRKGTTPDRTYIAGLSPYSNTPLVTSTTGPTVNTLYAMPFLVTEVTKFDTIRCQVTTLGSGSNLRMGIYYDDGTMYPGKLYFDSGNVSAASTGVKPATITSNLQAFQPGLYWLAYENSATVPQIKALPGAGSVWYFAGADNTIANPGGFAWSVTHTVGALPDPYTASATLITTASAVGTPVPAVGLRAIP